MKLQASSHFTMVELVLVIVLMALIMTVAVPSFNNILTGKRVVNAAQQVRAELNQARAYAVTNHAYVALIFPQNIASELSGCSNTALYNASFRAAIVTKNEATYTFQRWVPESKWEYLPTGIIIPAGTKNFGTSADKEYGETTVTAIANVQFEQLVTGLSSDRTTNIARAVIFTPLGQIAMSDTTSSLYLRLAEGTWNDAAFIYRNVVHDSSEKIVYTVLKVSPLTGKSKFLDPQLDDKPE